MKFYSKLQDWLAGPFSQKMQKFMQNPYMHALQVCFTIILPMIMVGSLASLFNTFRNFVSWLPDLSLINSFSFGLISIFMAFLIPYTIMESKKLQKQKMITGFASVSALIALAKSSVCGWKSGGKCRLCGNQRHDSGDGGGAVSGLAVFYLF